jgi:hypothetical protein
MIWRILKKILKDPTSNTLNSIQVRCDAASLGVPCTNCVAFSIECKIPAPKRKKTAGKKDTDRYVEVMLQRELRNGGLWQCNTDMGQHTAIEQNPMPTMGTNRRE